MLRRAASDSSRASGSTRSVLTSSASSAVGTDEKAAIAREHGAEHALVASRDDIAERVRELTSGKGVPVVFDSVGKATLQASLDSLSPRGMLVTFGNASGKPDPLDLPRERALPARPRGRRSSCARIPEDHRQPFARTMMA
jgi:NADPH:quinone reductase-like Zn-dependent oxidoreductase